MTKTILLIGANSAIAKALADTIITENRASLIVISRNTHHYQQAKFDNVRTITVKDYHEAEIAKAVSSIQKYLTLPNHHNTIAQVYLCHGVLHNERIKPEKRLEDFTAENYIDILHANTITPMLWLKHLVPILTYKKACKITVFNARVGSISDNRLGGWYSYRCSKSAINMLMKTLAIELARRAKNIKLISFHPGTTNTPLSQPFVHNVPKNKLFTANFVATKLLNIVEEMPVNAEVSYIDWQGKTINW